MYTNGKVEASKTLNPKRGLQVLSLIVGGVLDLGFRSCFRAFRVTGLGLGVLIRVLEIFCQGLPRTYTFWSLA